MTDKNIFVYKPFLSLNISDFSFFSLFFYVKTAPPPPPRPTPHKKSNPYLSQQPPSEILKSEN